MDGASDPASQQFMVQDADASPDIEVGPWHGGQVVKALQDQTGSPARAPLAVLGQLRLRPRCREMAVCCCTMATRHGSRRGEARDTVRLNTGKLAASR